MPIYEYQCANCGHQLEELQSFSEPPLTKCPNCGKDTLKRLIGGGAGLIFKGSGFYLTDYKNKSSQAGSKASKEKVVPDSQPAGDSKTPKETKKKDTK